MLKNWNSQLEKEHREYLLKDNPAYKDKIKKGFFYKQLPSKPSRFYMRDSANYLKEHGFQHAKILAYGCGIGTYLFYLWTQGFRNLEGRDIEQRFIDTANYLANQYQVSINFKLVKSETITNIQCDCDVLTFNDFLYAPWLWKEQGEDPKEILLSALSSVNEGGIVIFDYFDDHEDSKWDCWKVEAVKSFFAIQNYQVTVISEYYRTETSAKVLYALSHND